MSKSNALCFKSVLMFLLSVLLFLPAHAKEPFLAPEGLRALILEGIENNQEIKALQNQVLGMEDKAVSAGSLPDPSVGVAVLNLPADSLDFDREPMTQKQLSVSQKVPWPKRLALASQSVYLGAREISMRLEAARIDLAEKLARRYYELCYLSEKAKINRKLYDLVKRIEREATSRYTTGLGPQQDIFQAQVEALMLDEEFYQIETDIRRAKDGICALLNRQGGCEIEAPLAPLSPEELALTGDLAGEALADNPELAVKRAAYDRAKTDVLLAEEMYYPDFDVRAAYGQRDTDKTGRSLDDLFSLSVMVNVPLWYRSRQSKDLSAANRREDAALLEVRNLEASLPHEVDSLVARLGDSLSRYALYRESIIPQAMQRARAASDGYQVGKVPFDTMIDAQMMVMRLELSALEKLYEACKTRASLDALLGRPLGADDTGAKPAPKP